VDKRVLTHSGLGVKQVSARPSTVVQPFKLSSGVSHQDLSTISESGNITVFHARPVPTDILKGVVVSELQLIVFYILVALLSQH